MNRRVLARTSAIFAVLGGLLLSLVASQFLIVTPYTASGESLGNVVTAGSIQVVFTALSFAGLLAPLGMLMGLLGLYALLDASPVARGGLVVGTAAMLLLFALPIFPYDYFFDLSDPSPSTGTIEAVLGLSSFLTVLQALLVIIGLALLYVGAARARVLGTWRPLLPAIGLAPILASVAILVLPVVGLPGAPVFFEASRFVSGLLWVALGVAIWRHAPRAERRDARGGIIPANL